MKLFMTFALLICLNLTNATTIILAKNIKPNITEVLNQDLELLKRFSFLNADNPQLLSMIDLTHFSNESITTWLEERIRYVVSADITSPVNLKLKRSIYIVEKNVIYPNADLAPLSSESLLKNKTTPEEEMDNSNVQLSNIGASLYLSGKNEKILYGIKIPYGTLGSSKKIVVNSPRVGIVQIGASFITTLINPSKKKIKAWSNSIFRLGTLFHEARHSDGNGHSLAFVHAVCPRGHAYEGARACDENLNGPYTIGAHMIAEMAKECDVNCSVMDKETLLLATYDYFGRVLSHPHQGLKSTDWDPNPESL